jgi:hypothetical protein
VNKTDDISHVKEELWAMAIEEWNTSTTLPLLKYALLRLHSHVKYPE